MAVALLARPAAAFAASSVITVSADKIDAGPGDVITFSVILGPVEDMGTMQMALVIPDGLSYVSGSGRLADGLRNTLGYDTVSFAESSKIINGYASAKDYSSDTETLICTFQCKVEEGFSGTAEVSLSNLEFYSCQTWEDHTEEFSTGKAVINVSTESAPVSSDEPGQQTDPEPSGNTASGDTTQSGETTQPGGTTSDDTTQPSGSEPVDTTQSGNAETGDTTESGKTTPDDTTQSDNTEPADTAQSGNTTPENIAPSGSSGQTSSGNGDGQKPNGASSVDTNSNTSNNEKAPEPDNNGSQGSRDSQNSFLRWAAAIAAIMILAALLILLKHRKRSKKQIYKL